MDRITAELSAAVRRFLEDYGRAKQILPVPFSADRDAGVRLRAVYGDTGDVEGLWCRGQGRT